MVWRAHVSLFVRRARAVAWKRLREEGGVAMVEFALIATVLFTLIIGILYLGRYIYYQLDETHLANAGARYAAVGQLPTGCTSSTLAACIASQANGELATGSSDVNQVTVCVATGPGGAGNVGDPVTVTVVSKYSFLPILGIATVTDKETATMRLEASTASSTGIISQSGPGSCSP
jgi:Flp pilus assembly protein TadG